MAAKVRIDDDGDDLQVQMYQGDVQVAGAIIPMSLGDDQAYELARILGDAFKSVGDGAVSAPYKPR